MCFFKDMILAFLAMVINCTAEAQKKSERIEIVVVVVVVEAVVVIVWGNAYLLERKCKNC